MSPDLEIPYDLATIYGICTGNVTDELLEIYSEICDSFKNISYSGHVTELDYIESMLSSQTISTDHAVASVLETMLTAIEECLHTIGVSIDPDTPVGLLPLLMRSLLEFDVTDSPTHVNAIVEASEDPIECICDLLEYFTTVASETWMSYVTSVDTKCVEAIKYQLKIAMDRTVALDHVSDEQTRSQRVKVDEVKEILQDITLVDVSVESSSLEALYHLHVGSIVDMSPDLAIKEILGLAVMSNESRSNIDESIDLVLDDLFYDPSERMRINGQVTALKSKLNKLLY